MKLLEIDPFSCICHKTNENKVQKYKRDIEKGDVFPPIEVVFHNGLYYVKDGNHRTQAHKALNELVWAYVFDSNEYPNWYLIGARITKTK